MSEDHKISQRYRELAREEPPRHIDETILAAARRAAEARPAPLVAPSGRRRWYFPLAAAAIIVLAVAVTVHVERQQQRDVELAEAPPAPAKEGAAESLQFRAQRDALPASPPVVAQRQERARAKGAPAPALPAPQADVAQPKTKAELRRADEAASASSVMAKVGARSPEQWLQGIADLRRQGRHDEADKELAEFRRQYPDYRLTEEIRAKVERP